MKRSASITTGTTAKLNSRKKQKKADLVKDINGLSQEQFQHDIMGRVALDYTISGNHTRLYVLEHKQSSRMDAEQMQDCFDLIASTSMDDYVNSSTGWQPESKKREMADEDMHYLLCSASTDSSVTVPKAFVGFLSFMVTYDSAPVVPVLYIYEIHLTAESRGGGLGKHLLDTACTIARKTGVSKVMLTCYASNDRARRFYERYGFEVDPTSPQDRRTRGKVIHADHHILSMSVSRDERE